VAAGVALTAAAFPPAGLWPCAFAMLAPAAALAERRRGAAAFAGVWLYTFALGFAVTGWVSHALVDEYGVSRPTALAFMALLYAAYALVPASAAALHAALRSRVAAAWAPVLFAALWTAGEWLRAGPLGLPWVLAAHPLAFAPAAIQTAELGGASAPGLVVALSGAGLAVAVVRRAPGALVAPAIALAAAAGFGAWRLAAPPGDGLALRVGVVQAAVPQRERFQPGSALRNTLRHVALTRGLVTSEPLDLVVWSETAIDDRLDRVPTLVAQIEALVEETGVPLVTGAPREHAGRPVNSVVLFGPGAGLSGVYDKQRLVPFAESDPPGLGWLAPLLGPVTEGEPYLPGDGPRLLVAPPARIAAPVCFELTDAALMRDFRRAGADLVVNLSNDAWFGPTAYAEMHLAHAPFRAVELGTWVVRGTNTGISAVIDAQGRVAVRSELFREGVLSAEVRTAARETWYARHGDAPVLAALAGLAAGALGPGRVRPGAGRR
jgi:apolipoprotein N-acyltransferase